MDAARLLALAERVLRLEADSVLGLVPRLDGRFVAAVDLIYRCRGRVIVTGLGKSSHVARKVAATMASGLPLVLEDRRDAFAASSLARQADVVLDVGVREEACPMNLAPTSSTTAALAMGDALAMALLDLRGLRPEDYAALHPAGALGWRALVKVRDLMHTGEALPVVTEGATMKQVLEEMTDKRRGMTTVVDAAGRLAGIITDGDLRRLQLAGGTVLDRRAGECMTRNPKRIDAEALAATALVLMEAHQITSLVIVDDAGRPAAFIHLHDILSSKIA